MQGYAASGNTAYILDTLRWVSTYFIKCHHADLAFTAQVGDVTTDHALWERAEDMQEARPSADINPSAPGVAFHPSMLTDDDALGKGKSMAPRARLGRGHFVFKRCDP